MKLYVKDIVRKPNDTLYTFLYKVLRLDCNFYKQCTVDATYLNLDFTKLQCIAGKNRSFDDLVFISKTYFKVSDKSVAKVIKKLLDENNGWLFVFCDSAKKWILNRGLNRSLRFKYCAIYDKSDYKTEKYGEGEYSFDNIINLMGLTKEDIKLNY
jgi:hypothetical protein